MAEPKNGITVTVTMTQDFKPVDAAGKNFIPDGPPAPTLEQLVDADIDAFEEFFKALGNDGLAGGERAAIKTYLWFKTHPEDPRGKTSGS